MTVGYGVCGSMRGYLLLGALWQDISPGMAIHDGLISLEWLSIRTHTGWVPSGGHHYDILIGHIDWVYLNKTTVFSKMDLNLYNV